MSSAPRIEPRILKGFRDTLPQVAAAREKMIRSLAETFSSFGFAPIDTPALEYAEILLGKGSDETDKQLYRFMDNGGREVALRFDLTVPLARFIAMHVNEVGTPFKRYHIAPVWRAEKPQRGRYREFYQCDFDIIGPTSTIADSEIVSLVGTAMEQLGVNFRIRLNNRRILNGLLESVGAADRSVSVLRAIDKLEKIGREGVEKELREFAGLDGAGCEKIFSFLALSEDGTESESLLHELEKRFSDNALATQGISELSDVLQSSRAFGLDANRLVVDLSIARGLGYYTGTVLETAFLDLPGIGSICSGGRYDDLASLYTSRRLPGVGCSVGLDRIMGALEELGRFGTPSSGADVLIAVLDDNVRQDLFRLAGELRRASIAVEVYPERDGLGGQLKYGAKKGIPLVLIAGERELSQKIFAIKDLRAAKQIDGIPLAECVARVTELLR